MPKDINQKRKEAEERRHALVAEQMQQKMLQEQALKTEPKDGVKKEDDEDQVHYELDPVNSKKPNYQKLFKNFEEQFGKENIKGNMLCFSSDKEAEQFFKQQADKGLAFEMKKCGEDKVAFSDGKGHFKMGTSAEIAEFKEQLSKGLLDNKTPETKKEHDSRNAMTPFNMTPNPMN